MSKGIVCTRSILALVVFAARRGIFFTHPDCLVKSHAVGRPVEPVHQMLRVACLGLQVFDGAVFVQSKFLLAIDFCPEEWYTVLAGLLAGSIGSAALVGGVSTGGGIFIVLSP